MASTRKRTAHRALLSSSGDSGLPAAPLGVGAVVAEMTRGMGAGRCAKIAVGVAARAGVVHGGVGVARMVVLSWRRMPPQNKISRRGGSSCAGNRHQQRHGQNSSSQASMHWHTFAAFPLLSSPCRIHKNRLEAPDSQSDFAHRCSFVSASLAPASCRLTLRLGHTLVIEPCFPTISDCS
jgi:hypothetical protein